MSEDILRDLDDLRSLSEEDAARAILDLTLQAAPPDVADAVRVCALPAWFDAAHLALLLALPPTGGEPEGGQEANALLEQVADFSFVLPREAGGANGERSYVYHEATRARLLDWWREPEHADRLAALSERLARPYLALAREQRARLSGPDYLDALFTLDGAYPNIGAAWEGAVASGHWELVRGFAYAQADYQDKRGLWAETQTWARKGLEACEHLEDEAGRADMQNNLGNAYLRLPTGDRAENLQQAINCYNEALRFWTPEAAPLDYAMTQNNLGTAYAQLPTGDRAENLVRAIGCYEEALRVYTPEAAPLQYAATQNNLGTAYRRLPTGDRAENLARAIGCHEEALRFRTPEAAPLGYAMTQNNLAMAYVYLPTGDRAANLQQGLRHAEAALRIENPYPSAKAAHLFTRGLVHLALGHQDQALKDHQAALDLADPITVTEARQDVDRLAADYPDTPGLDAVRALFETQPPAGG